MNFSKKIHKLVGKNENLVIKPQKHDANLQKNSTLYFQIGLILCLLASYGLFEMNFESKPFNYIHQKIDESEPVYVVNIAPEIKAHELKKEIRVIPQKKVNINKLEIVDNNVLVTPKALVPSITINTPKISTPKKKVVKKSPPIRRNILNVEQVPIYPGCEGLSTNTERRQCMSKKIGKLVLRKFNTDIAENLGLKGKQRIWVEFKIDKTGNVSEIKANAPHAKLKKEAIRVVEKIPQMIPGKQKDKNVEVIYSLPILFQVQY